mmetsp:Transcript_3234/g.6289  ORF Transcript_3234/g.6289 Transcript_3234/m.6289 type:complete len:93 (+) Transcript_3234:817-1095(+)
MQNFRNFGTRTHLEPHPNRSRRSRFGAVRAQRCAQNCCLARAQSLQNRRFFGFNGNSKAMATDFLNFGIMECASGGSDETPTKKLSKLFAQQ